MTLTKECPSCKGSCWITPLRDQKKWDEYYEKMNESMVDPDRWEEYNELMMQGPPMIGHQCSTCKGEGYVLTNDGKEMKKLREAIEQLQIVLGVKSA